MSENPAASIEAAVRKMFPAESIAAIQGQKGSFYRQVQDNPVRNANEPVSIMKDVGTSALKFSMKASGKIRIRDSATMRKRTGKDGSPYASGALAPDGTAFLLDMLEEIRSDGTAEYVERYLFSPFFPIADYEDFVRSASIFFSALKNAFPDTEFNDDFVLGDDLTKAFLTSGEVAKKARDKTRAIFESGPF